MMSLSRQYQKTPMVLLIMSSVVIISLTILGDISLLFAIILLGFNAGLNYSINQRFDSKTQITPVTLNDQKKRNSITQAWLALIRELPAPIYLLDHNRKIIAFNEEAADIVGAHALHQDIALYMRQNNILKAIDTVALKRKAQVVRFETAANRVFDVTIQDTKAHPSDSQSHILLFSLKLLSI